MINNQFARRNLSNYVRGGLGLRLEEFFSLRASENRSIAVTISNIERANKNSINSDSANSPKLEKSVIEKIDTREEVAKVAGIGSNTISKIKEIKNCTPEEVLSDLEAHLVKGDISINQAHKFVRAIKGIKNCGEVARKAIEEFNKNPNIPLENKARDIIREKEREERDRILKENEERKRLENNILENGFNPAFPIITWNNTIVDGHNRYNICKKHGIEFSTISQEGQDY